MPQAAFGEGAALDENKENRDGEMKVRVQRCDGRIETLTIVSGSYWPLSETQEKSEGG